MGSPIFSYAKANPGKVRVGHPGIGTIPHMDSEQLKMMAGIDLTTVPFAGGGESVPAMLGGHVEAVSQHPNEVLPHVKAGKARVLLVYEKRRNPLFPEAPTAKELGYDITMGCTTCLSARKAFPRRSPPRSMMASRKPSAIPCSGRRWKGRASTSPMKGPRP